MKLFGNEGSKSTIFGGGDAQNDAYRRMSERATGTAPSPATQNQSFLQQRQEATDSTVGRLTETQKSNLPFGW